MIKLSVIIPAYNEEQIIEQTLMNVYSYLSTQTYTSEIIVIVNNTTDKTEMVAENTKKAIDILRVYNIGTHENETMTKGLAVKRGVEYAVGEYVLFMDADNATNITEIENFWPEFERGADAVIASRYIHGARISVPQPWYRELAARMGNIVIRCVLLPKIHDTQCGFKMFRAKAAKFVFDKMTILGWGFDLEILSLLKMYDYKIKEMPVVWHDVKRGRVKFEHFVATFKEVFLIRKKIDVGEYKEETV